MAAAILIPMSAQSSSPAYLNGVHGAQMITRHPVGSSIVLTVLTEDISHLDALRRPHRMYRLKLFGYTIEGTGDLRQVYLADVQINGRGRGRPVTEKQLNVMQARPRLYQMSGKAVP